MHAHSTTAPAATRRILLTLTILTVGLVTVLAVRIDALAHGGPHMAPLATGTIDERISIKTHPQQTTQVTTFQLGFDSAQAATPWHGHPGSGVVTINEGTFELTRVVDGACVTATYEPGDVFVDPGDGTVHRLQLVAGNAGKVTATFFTPAGVPVSQPAAAPSC